MLTGAADSNDVNLGAWVAGAAVILGLGVIPWGRGSPPADPSEG